MYIKDSFLTTWHQGSIAFKRAKPMRITKRTNIAIRVLMYCATHTDRLVTKAEIAESCGTSQNHMAQVVNQLAHLGYLKTQRGRTGGMMLGQPASEIPVGAVFRAIEAQVPASECFADADNTCPLVSACFLRLALVDAVEAFYAHLDGLSLDALVCDNVPLRKLLQPVECPA
jgi:Rrf2 family nitric oxide-sensitive transcriptional repressor